MVEGKRENKTTTTTKNKHFLKRKRRQEMSASNLTKSWIHVIRVHDTSHLAVTTTAGQQTLTNYHEELERTKLVHLYINYETNEREKNGEKVKHPMKGSKHDSLCPQKP